MVTALVTQGVRQMFFSKLKFIVAILVAVLFVGAGAGLVTHQVMAGKDRVAAPDKAKDAPKDKPTLLRTWVQSEPKKMGRRTITFTKDNMVNEVFAEGGGVSKTEGTYVLDGDKLTITTSTDGKETKRLFTVKSLTDQELVLASDKGQEEKFSAVGKDKP